jgi:2-oxoglutarate/2-oxoacid ferredoxin oxidoreductase subunit alpha
VSWGSIAGVAEEAFELARGEGLHVKLLVPKLLYPVAEDVYRDFFASVRAGLVVEQSYLGQLWRLLKMFVGVPAGIEAYARPGAVPISPDEIVARLRQLAATLQRQQTPEPAPVE